jgi:hypothetical protein
MPFPMPFCFPDGQSCSNFNQLALACDERWNEARNLLAQGIWQSFFTAMGRLDLASAAKQAAQEPDLDVGLTHLLEKFPADDDALRPPKLAVLQAEENLGTLEPGKDHKFELAISNQGMLVLRGMVVADCDWLSFGDRTAAGPASKMFQTRHKYSLPVRVLGDKVRAGRKPLEGQIVIDTNGGCITVPVRASVPVRPFPKGQYANDVLAGAKSPHELAVKAKAHPEEAAVLFEQGAVKAWYASNGWTYPIQGTEGTGKGAVQQFFEVLGLTKPPRLEINAGKIVCAGKAGERLTQYVTVSTKESRFVYAQGWSNHDWIQAGPGKPQGNSVKIPLVIEVPRRAGETLRADVTILGNGQQRFVVPVTLSVGEGSPDDIQEVESVPDEPNRRLPLGWVFAGAGVLLLLIAVGIGAMVLGGGKEDPGPPIVDNLPPPPPPPPKAAWWDHFPDSGLAATVVAVKDMVPQQSAVFDGIAANSDVERYKFYEELGAKLPDMLGNLKARDPLGRFLVSCVVFEPSNQNIKPLRRALGNLLPADGVEFRAEDKAGELDRAFYSLQLYFEAMTHKAKRPDRVQDLANDLSRALGSTWDSSAPPERLRAQMEKMLAERCYMNTLPTATKSIEYALAMRLQLMEKFGRQLSAAFRAKVDADLIAFGLKGNVPWAKLEPLLKTCLESNEPAVGWKILDAYEQAQPELAQQMEKGLALRWKAIANPKLTQADKAAAIRKNLVSTKVSPEERRKQLQKLIAFKPGLKKENTPLLQDTVRLAHASTMACLLFREDGDLEGFDELVIKVPEIQSADPAKTKPEEKGKQAVPKGAIVVDFDRGPKVITGQMLRGEFTKDYPVWMRAGQVYSISLVSRAFVSTLRLESPNGRFLRGSPRSFTPRLVYPAPADGVCRVSVTVLPGSAGGPFTLVIQQNAGFGGPFMIGPRVGPIGVPVKGPFGVPGNEPVPEEEPKTIAKKDLDDLDSKQNKVRVAAFLKIAGLDCSDLTPRQAKKIAAYLFSFRKDQKNELDEVAAKLDAFGKCRNLLLALADNAARDDITKLTTETIVGGVLGKPLRFDPEEDWHSESRRLLLRRALELTTTGAGSADQAAKILGELYKEQGLAFGIEDSDFLTAIQPTRVLEGVIKQVATKPGKQNTSGEDKDFLEQIGRHLQAAQFVAENDLEYMVLLQRHWLKVLTIYLQEKAPPQAKAMMLKLQSDLAQQDRQSRSVLEQLRAGEEKVLALWVLAYQLK